MMNEVQIVSATLQRVVLDVVANFRAPKGAEEKHDAHSHLLMLFGMNLSNRGFHEDGLKLEIASICSQNTAMLQVLELMVAETQRKDLENALTKIKAQHTGYILDTYKYAGLFRKYEELKLSLDSLIPVVKYNLHAENPKLLGSGYDCMDLLEDGKMLLNDARTLEWGDYKAWNHGVSTASIYEAAIKLLLASVNRKDKKGLKFIESYLRNHKNTQLEELLNELNDENKSMEQPVPEMPSVKPEYDLNRFLKAQEWEYETALMEMHDGAKESHWIWYIFPQLKGLGHSYNSQFYGLDGVEEARAYLNHPVLGTRLREISETLLQHRRKSIHAIMGSSIDVLKLKTCMQLFDSISPDDVFDKVLETFFKNEI